MSTAAESWASLATLHWQKGPPEKRLEHRTGNEAISPRRRKTTNGCMIPLVCAATARAHGPGKATIAQTGTVRRVLPGDGKARAPARARWVRPLASGRSARCETRGVTGGRRRANCHWHCANFAPGPTRRARQCAAGPGGGLSRALAQARPRPLGPGRKRSTSGWRVRFRATGTVPGSTPDRNRSRQLAQAGRRVLA